MKKRIALAVVALALAALIGQAVDVRYNCAKLGHIAVCLVSSND